jgi:hypothetical protein
MLTSTPAFCHLLGNQSVILTKKYVSLHYSLELMPATQWTTRTGLDERPMSKSDKRQNEIVIRENPVLSKSQTAHKAAQAASRTSSNRISGVSHKEGRLSSSRRCVGCLVC